jgi:protein-S-isoprenylcysteine O-methyltransferase Ste14
MRRLSLLVTFQSAKFLLVLALVLFASAGTLRFWQAWVYLGLHLASLVVTCAYFVAKDEALVERRRDRPETESVQKLIKGGMNLFGAAMLVVAGLDRRFAWSSVPASLVLVACFVFAFGSALVFVVFRANTYGSSIIEVQKGQTVVATGPYRALRHPMYTGMALMGMATPFLLGSFWAALLVPPGWVLLVVRILAEERLLGDRLPGYREYLGVTRRRLIPGVW